MLEVILAFFLGVTAGLALGLIPGLHPNMAAFIAAAFIASSPLPAVVFLAAMAATNVISDFIPSVFLGAPEEGTEMAVMPGHRMLLMGRGYDAVRLSVFGAVGACIFVIVSMPAVFLFLPSIFVLIKPYTHGLLAFVLSVMVLSEKYFFRALFVAFAAGTIGIFSSRLPISSELMLLPMLSGMFGLSYLLLQGKQTGIPEQTFFKTYVTEKKTALAVVKGSLGGIVSGFLPGVGSSQIAAFFAASRHSNETYLITIGAIAWSNLFLSILSLWLIGRPRSGIAVAMLSVADINFSMVLYIITALAAATAIAAIVTLFIAKNFVKRISGINYKMLNRLVIGVIVTAVAVFTGFAGIFLLAVCTCMGIYANTAGVKRSIMMSALIIPTILFYMGVQ